MTNEPDKPDKCEACGREFSDWQPGPYVAPASTEPPYDMRTIAAQKVQRHNELLDKLTVQLEELLELARDGKVNSSEVLAQLEALRQNLSPRHGLCIDRSCALCRVQEEAIKEHVLVYVDWRVPGTIQKLQQARHRN
jgi:hypothetical protein